MDFNNPNEPKPEEFDYPYEADTSRSISSRSDLVNSGKLNPLSPPNKNSSESLKSEEESSSNNGSTAGKESKLKGMIRFFFSNFGMIFLVILYVLGGAYLFKLLEQHEEIQTCQMGQGEDYKMVNSYRQTLFNYIYFNITSNPWLPVDNDSIIASLNYPRDPPDVYNPKITQLLLDFRDEVLAIYSKYKYRGQDCEQRSLWNYQSALLFTMNVVTTIGYGHVAPATWEGQIVIICYATIGIPLFLLTIANMSGILGDMFRFVYSSIFCFAFSKKKSEQKEVEPKSEKNEHVNEHGKQVEVAKDKSLYDDDEEEEEEEEGKIQVPLIVVLITIIAYVLLGGYIFQQLESWTMIQGSYFSFISLATIGFGDFVPGISEIQDGKEDIGGRNLIVATIYIFFGMAILAMCFDLMQEELIEKFTIIGQKLGISRNEDEITEVYDDTDATELKAKSRFSGQKGDDNAQVINNDYEKFYCDPTNLRIRNSLTGNPDANAEMGIGTGFPMKKLPTRYSVKPFEETARRDLTILDNSNLNDKFNKPINSDSTC